MCNFETNLKGTPLVEGLRLLKIKVKIRRQPGLISGTKHFGPQHFRFNASTVLNRWLSGCLVSHCEVGPSIKALCYQNTDIAC